MARTQWFRIARTMGERSQAGQLDGCLMSSTSEFGTDRALYGSGPSASGKSRLRPSPALIRARQSVWLAAALFLITLPAFGQNGQPIPPAGEPRLAPPPQAATGEVQALGEARPTPAWVTYNFFFNHLAYLDQAGDEQEALGNRDAADAWRGHEQHAAGLTDAEGATLKRLAFECNRAVKEQDAKIGTVIKALRDQAEHAAPLSKADAQPEMSQLWDDRAQIIDAYVEQLRLGLGQATFEKLEGHIRTTFQPDVTTAPSPADLSTPSIHVESHITLGPGLQARAECQTTMVLLGALYHSVAPLCSLHHGAHAQALQCNLGNPTAGCSLPVSGLSPGETVWAEGIHYLNLMLSPVCAYNWGLFYPSADPLHFGHYDDPYHCGYPCYSDTFSTSYGETGDAPPHDSLQLICMGASPAIAATRSQTHTAREVRIQPPPEILPGQTYQFIATINPMPDSVTWSIEGTDPPMPDLMISGDSFTAPANDRIGNVETITIKACSNTETSVCDTTHFSINHIDVEILATNPWPAAAGATQTLTAIVHGPSSSNPDVTWKPVEKGSIERIDGHIARYTAPTPAITAVVAIEACLTDYPAICGTLSLQLVAPVTVTGVSPNAWAAGSHDPTPSSVPVTINGTGFSPTSTVILSDGTFNRTFQETNVQTQITGTVAVPLMLTKFNVTVTVKTTTGTLSLSATNNNVTILGPTVAVAITQAQKALTLLPTQKQRFTLQTLSCKTLATGGPPCSEIPSVVWSAVKGTFDPATGEYTAPSVDSQTTDTVTVTARWSPAVAAFDTATVTLKPIIVTVNPTGTSVKECESKPFSATVQNATSPTVTWTAPSIGTITPGGMYTAPCPYAGAAQNVKIEACSTVDRTCGSTTVKLLAELDAAFSSQVPPVAGIKTGATAQVSVTMTNTGSNDWTAAGGYRLGSQNPQDNQMWGVGRVDLAAGEIIKSGATKKFTFDVVAPATAGTYNFQWRMLRENVGWFGASTSNVAVTVVQGPSKIAPIIGGLCCPIRRGPTSGGTIVIIPGSNFVSGATVAFGIVRSTNVTFNSSSQLTAVTPPHAAGVVDIVVTNPDGQGDIAPGAFTYADPTISSISPNSGLMAGGTAVTITGSEFGTGATVTIGGVAAKNVTLVSPSQITATTGAHACGSADVVVRNPDNHTATLAGGFSYTSPQPPTGLTPNGTVLPSTTTSVTLRWTATSGATQYAVRVRDNTDGTIRDSRNNCASPTMYLCVDGVVGTSYTVAVQAGHTYDWWLHAGSSCGKYSTQTNASFIVARPAHPTAIAPANGPMAGGTALTISGTDFQSGATVTIGGAAATNVVIVSSTQITATTPAHACGTVDVVVKNAGDQSGTLSGGFFYTSPQPPTGLTPTAGTILPSTTTSVTLRWTAVSGATQYAVRVQDNTDPTVRLPGNNCPVDTLYVCRNGVTTTSFSVPVVAGHSYSWWVHSGSSCGQYSTQTNSSFIIAAPAHPTAISPANGAMAGGTAVTITGTGFQSGATVTIGGAAATNVVIVSPTQITATTPAHACGTVDVVVKNAGDQSGTLSGGFFYTSPQPPSGLAPNGAILAGTTTSVTLTWSATSGATQYAVRVRDNTDGTIRDPRNNCANPTVYLCVDGVAGTSYTVPVLAGHHYDWWLHAGSSCGQYSTQTNASFQVADKPPKPTGISPANGPMAGGTAVTIIGTDFQSGATVTIGGVAATGVTLVSSTQINATSAAHACGNADVVVKNPDNQAGTLSGGFYYGAPLSPTGLTPSSNLILPATTTSLTLSWAATPGATQYAVRVQDLTGASAPDPRNNCPNPGSAYVCVDGVATTTFVVTVKPGHSYQWWLHAGNSCGQYSVQTYATFSVAAPASPPTPASISPVEGTLIGGTPVTISGNDFKSGATVSFGGVAATVTSVSTTQITATTLAHACGTVDVVVKNPDGQTGTLSGGFYFSAPPAPSGLTPSNNMILPATTTSVTLSWAATPGATQYAVRVQDLTGTSTPDPRNNCPNPGSAYVCVDGVRATSFVVTVAPGRSYQWWLHAGNDCAKYNVPPTYATFSVAADVLLAPTNLRYEGFPSRNVLWAPPDNLKTEDHVRYDLWLYGPSCPAGCNFQPGAASWYTIGPSIQGGTYTWKLQAISAYRPSAGFVNGPAFTLTQLDLSINRTTFHVNDPDWIVTLSSSLVGSGVTVIEEYWNGSGWQEDWRGSMGQVPASGVLSFVSGAPFFTGSFRSHVEAGTSSSNYVNYSVSP